MSMRGGQQQRGFGRGTWALVLGSLLSACASHRPAIPPGDHVLAKQGGGPARDELVRKARAAEREGRFSSAERLFEKAEARGHSTVDRARLWLETGRYQQIVETFSEESPPELLYLRLLALRHTGAVEQALGELKRGWALETLPASAASCPQISSPASSLSSRAWLLLGELQIELGDRTGAEASLGALVDCAMQVEPKFAPLHFVYAGRGAALIRKHELANELFNRAEVAMDATAQEREYRDLLLYRGRLFLEKNDHAQALSISTELSERFPHDLSVRLFQIQLLAETQFDFAAAEKGALGLLQDNPQHLGALFVLAGTELRDMNLETASDFVERGLGINPRDLDLRSMRAAVLFLGEQPQAFEAELQAIDALSPKNIRPYEVVAEYAEWEHRYPDLERLMRRAVRIDREAATVRTRLGLTLVRAGSDPAGIVELNRAYDLDPYNLRVINTLNLYEKIIPRDYVSIRQGHFRYRFPKDDAELLLRYVPALLERGYEEMHERYGYTPPSPIDIELYENDQQFAVRTSGVPSIGIQGVCFGHKLATVSPSGSPANLGMTLWHELGHVFHIGLSGYRVPRYLTEGLAEWETAQRQVGWSRELDRELHQVRQEGALPPLSEMSRAFTHARRAEDVAAAYYASGLLSEWLVDRFGQKRVVGVLAELGEGQLAKQVVPEVLGMGWQELDAAFSDFLDQRLRPLQDQFTPVRPRDEAQDLRPLLKEHPTDPELRLRLALSLLAEGAHDEARPLLEQLHEEKNLQATFALIRLALANEDKKRARALLSEMFEAKADGYELRMLSARLHLVDEENERGVSELKAALEFDASAEEVRRLLVDYYRRTNQPELELEQLRAWAYLSEHDAPLHRRLVELLIEQSHIGEAVEAAERAIWVDLAGAETHRLAGLAYARDQRLTDAQFEWESALLCPALPDQLLRLRETWVGELSRRGQRAQAQKVGRRIDEKIEQLMKNVPPMPRPEAGSREQ